MATTVRRLKAIIEAKDEASQKIARIGSALAGLGVSAVAFVAASRVIRETGRQLANTVKASAEFESAMSGVRALTGSTGKEFDRLSKRARELGATTVFTATEAAGAMQEFARAGFDTSEIYEVTGATLDLAAAGAIELSRAAEIAANTIRGFGLDTSQSRDVIDLLAKTATSSSQTVGELGDSLAFVAPGANLLTLSLEDTAAALAVLADRGIKAGLAGRPLRSAFLKLVPALRGTSVETESLSISLDAGADGALSLVEVLDQLTQQGVTAANITELFDSAQAAVISTLLENRDALDEARTALSDYGGTAQEIAAKQLDNLEGSVKLLESAFNSLQITVGGPLRQVLRRTIDNVLIPYIVSTDTAISSTNAYEVAVLESAVAAAKAIKEYEALVPSVDSARLSFGLTARLVKFFAGDVGLLTNAVRLLDGAFKNAAGTTEETKSSLDPLIEALESDLKNALEKTGSDAESTKERIDELRNALAEAAAVAVASRDAFREALPSEFIELDPEGFAFETPVDLARELAVGLEATNAAARIALQDALPKLKNRTTDLIKETNKLGDAYSTALGNTAAGAARDLADTLVSAALDGQIAFGEFFKKLFRDLARAILQAIILQSILGVFSKASIPKSTSGVGPFGVPLFLSRGGIVGARRGLIVGGGVDTGADKVPILARPGEAVLPPELTRFLLDAARGAGGGGPVVIEAQGDMAAFIAALNFRVRTGRQDLVSTEVVTSRVSR